MQKSRLPQSVASSFIWAPMNEVNTYNFISDRRYANGRDTDTLLNSGSLYAPKAVNLLLSLDKTFALP